MLYPCDYCVLTLNCHGRFWLTLTAGGENGVPGPGVGVEGREDGGRADPGAAASLVETTKLTLSGC